MALGLGASLGKTGLITPGVVTDNLVMKHMYPAGAVQPLSDGAVYFDGSDSYISASTLTFTDSMSFCMWVRSDASASGAILTSYEDASNAVTIGIYGNKVDARFIGANTIQRASGTWTHQAWNHIACVCDSGTADTGLTVYINGVVSTTSTSNSLGIADATGTVMGARKQSSAYDYDFEGYVCNVGVWNDLLTQLEIKSIMWKQYADLTTGTDSESDDLINWWALDEGEGTSVADSKGSLTGALTA